MFVWMSLTQTNNTINKACVFFCGSLSSGTHFFWRPPDATQCKSLPKLALPKNQRAFVLSCVASVSLSVRRKSPIRFPGDKQVVLLCAACVEYKRAGGEQGNGSFVLGAGSVFLLVVLFLPGRARVRAFFWNHSDHARETMCWFSFFDRTLPPSLLPALLLSCSPALLLLSALCCCGSAAPLPAAPLPLSLSHAVTLSHHSTDYSPFL